MLENINVLRIKNLDKHISDLITDSVDSTEYLV